MKITKYEIKGHENYAATIVTVTELHTLDGLDNLKGLRIFGYQALVSATTQIGSKMIVFVAGCKLSDSFLSGNNLYRHPHLNSDKNATGYIEDNGRVKAIRLRKHQSDALAMPIESLNSMFSDRWVDELKPGVIFDTFEGVTICEKFILKPKGSQGIPGGKSVSKKLVPDGVFPEHYDTSQFARNSYKYSDQDHVVVTQKLHGTSVRFGNVLIPRKLKLLDRIAKFFGASVQEQEYAFVAGSRRVITSVNGSGSDLWSTVAGMYSKVIPQGVMVYGEIIGWTPGGAAIQKNYTYNQSVGCCKLYVYRVTTLSPTGIEYDLSWADLEKFCNAREMETVPVLLTENFSKLSPSDFLNIKLADRYNSLVLSDPKSVDEGVCFRNQYHIVTKHKSPMFLEYESKMMDQQVEDIESQDSGI